MNKVRDRFLLGFFCMTAFWTLKAEQTPQANCAAYSGQAKLACDIANAQQGKKAALFQRLQIENMNSTSTEANQWQQSNQSGTTNSSSAPTTSQQNTGTDKSKNSGGWYFGY